MRSGSAAFVFLFCSFVLCCFYYIIFFTYYYFFVVASFRFVLFFHHLKILYNSRGFGGGGERLPDAMFAQEVSATLEKEQKGSGLKCDVFLQDAANVANMEATIDAMCKSYVVVIVFSEAALQSILD